jgi:hypothetical protein
MHSGQLKFRLHSDYLHQDFLELQCTNDKMRLLTSRQYAALNIVGCRTSTETGSSLNPKGFVVE